MVVQTVKIGVLTKHVCAIRVHALCTTGNSASTADSLREHKHQDYCFKLQKELTTTTYDDNPSKGTTFDKLVHPMCLCVGSATLGRLWIARRTLVDPGSTPVRSQVDPRWNPCSTWIVAAAIEPVRNSDSLP